MLLNICSVIIFLFSVFLVWKTFLQKDIFIKLLFLNSSTSLIALFICFLGTYKVNSSYIDIAIIYFILSAITTSAYLKYFLQKHKGDINAKK